jgi:hypothetical protein
VTASQKLYAMNRTVIGANSSRFLESPVELQSLLRSKSGIGANLAN